MKALRDPQQLLHEGLAEIRAQFDVPAGFAPEVLAAASEAAARQPDRHADWTDRHFVTLDPASATDLDQAFAIEPGTDDIVFHYAIADVGWFVRDGDALDAEAWQRGSTCYLPDGKASLYPPALGEAAASLLPDGPRPAVVLSLSVARGGEVSLAGVTRALIRSRAKLAYETAQIADLPDGFAALTDRLAEAEAARGAARVDPPEQQLEPDGRGGFTLAFRPWSDIEERNAALSLAANIAVARALLAGGTGLFRVMAAPDEQAIAELRATARAFALGWPETMPLTEFEKQLDPARPADAAFMLAIRRSARGASYQAWEPGLAPWHAAIAAPYAHCTAPLRRLADRHVLEAVLALAHGEPVPAAIGSAFARLPRVMARAGSRDARIDRAVIDLAEAAMLAHHEGRSFRAVVTDIRLDRAQIQLCDLPVVTTIEANGAVPGQMLVVTLLEASPARRELRFEAAPGG